ncbi:hypothetical protein [Stenotrophomonas sp.]|uniref:hypothetical protein n=1 Tax=Stenotrophomonas sp. TaxID=69392 RepID=UPI0028A1D361|nr:hypothetical protein [Stenotrophomonas sp.]
MTNRILRPAFLMMVLTLQLACSPEQQHTSAATAAAAYDESVEAQANGENSITIHRAQPKVMRSVTPHSTGELPSSTSTRASHHLEAEEKYIGEVGIEADAIDQVLQSREAFTTALHALDSESIRSMEAQDLTRHFRAVMELALGNEVTVSSLACGLSVCLGSVQKRAEIDEKWAHTFLDHDAIKVFGFGQAEDQMGDVHERRFLFSIDPGLPGVIVRRAP